MASSKYSVAISAILLSLLVLATARYLPLDDGMSNSAIVEFEGNTLGCIKTPVPCQEGTCRGSCVCSIFPLLPVGLCCC